MAAVVKVHQDRIQDRRDVFEGGKQFEVGPFGPDHLPFLFRQLIAGGFLLPFARGDKPRRRYRRDIAGDIYRG